MLYSEAAKHLLRGLRARRRSWARGVYVVMQSTRQGRVITDDLLGAILNLALLTPNGTHRYFSHSIDRDAADWEIINGDASRV